MELLQIECNEALLNHKAVKYYRKYCNFIFSQPLNRAIYVPL